MQSARRVASVIALISLTAFAEEKTATPSAAIDTQLAAIVSRHHVPGIAALALSGHSIVGAAASGVRKLGEATPLTVDDKFHLGSDTKAMTATLVALSISECKLDWSTPVGELLPPAHAAWREITVQQLLSHRSGLSKVAGAGWFWTARPAPLPLQRRAYAVDLLRTAPAGAPRTYEYSNANFILAGTILEVLNGKAWEEQVQEQLFAPLGMSSAGFGPPRGDSALAQPWGHRANGTPVDPRDSGADNPAGVGPAGTVHATLADWSRFVALHLRGNPANPHHEAKLLPVEAFTHLHTPAAGENYVGGWIVGTRAWAKGNQPNDTGRVLTHAGSNTMWFCVAWLAPEIDFAVLVACNQGGDAASKACDEAAGLMIKRFSAAAR